MFLAKVRFLAVLIICTLVFIHEHSSIYSVLSLYHWHVEPGARYVGGQCPVSYLHCATGQCFGYTDLIQLSVTSGNTLESFVWSWLLPGTPIICRQLRYCTALSYQHLPWGCCSHVGVKWCLNLSQLAYFQLFVSHWYSDVSVQHMTTILISGVLLNGKRGFNYCWDSLDIRCITTYERIHVYPLLIEGWHN